VAELHEAEAALSAFSTPALPSGAEPLNTAVCRP
jgi:hypothetical protein